MKNETVPVPVDDGMMKSIAQLSGGQTSTAENIDELTKDFGAVEDQMGYQVESGPASAGWLRIAVALSAVGALLALLINRRLPVENSVRQPPVEQGRGEQCGDQSERPEPNPCRAGVARHRW